MKKRRKKIKIKKKVIFAILLLMVGLGMFAVINYGTKFFAPKKMMYVGSNNHYALLYNEDFEEVSKINRGSDVKIRESNYIKNDKDEKFYDVLVGDKKFYISENNLISKKEDAVMEKNVYVRTPATVLEDLSSSKIVGMVSKGDELEVVGYDELMEDGSVSSYKIKKEDVTGYIYSKYLVLSYEESILNYEASKYDAIHSKIKNTYGGGDAIKLDFYPVEKPSFTDNVMPDNVYSLYLNGTSNVLSRIDDYIAFAKDTEINAFVVDVKDSTVTYESKVCENMSPRHYKNAFNTVEEYKTAIKKLKDAGFYVIGRIVLFKDSYYVSDHPENAISSSSSGKPYYHQNAYWPTPYSRDVWYFNVELAKEAIKEFGFNEINFDYVRFPDRLRTAERNGLINMKNNYNEDKAQAIQRFLQYATDEIHNLNVYVSVDVFGEATNASYTTAYGQYWPAISNVVDVISGMPYPDHFSSGYYGLSKPWNHPYELMLGWGSEAMDRQKETTSPAVVRTWIQAYNVQSYVDANGIDYNADEIEAQVKGLFDAGCTGGYITWLSSSNILKYQMQKDGFKIDYGKGLE